MKTFLIIVLILILVLVLISLYFKKINRKILEYFNKGNVIVYGAKGKGKDLLFQKVIILKRKEKYLSNIDYGYNGAIRPIKSLSVEPNTYENFINGTIRKIDKINELEGLDYYLSDGGTYLPCQYDYLLHKQYPSFPIYYALSRHLYNSNIHVNTQALSRVWKAIREQADGFIKCTGVINLPLILICKIRFYDKYESALNNMLPLSARSLNKYSKANVDQYYATNGEIKNAFYIIRKKDIQYNTRFFEKVIFNNETITERTHTKSKLIQTIKELMKNKIKFNKEK